MASNLMSDKVVWIKEGIGVRVVVTSAAIALVAAWCGAALAADDRMPPAASSHVFLTGPAAVTTMATVGSNGKVTIDWETVERAAAAGAGMDPYGGMWPYARLLLCARDSSRCAAPAN